LFLKTSFINLPKPLLKSRVHLDFNNLKTWLFGLETFSSGLRALSSNQLSPSLSVEKRKPAASLNAHQAPSSPALLVSLADFKSQVGFPCPWPVFSVGVPSEQMTLMRALQCACGDCGETALAVQTTLKTLNLNHLSESLKQTNPDKTDASAWHVVWLLALTPTGLDSLSAWQAELGGSAFAVTAHAREKLQTLAHVLKAGGFLHRNMQSPSLLFPEILQLQDQSAVVLQSALKDLLGDQAGWAANAVRNGLYSNAKNSDFDLINRRLEKVGCWAKRAQTPVGLNRLSSFWHKSPFSGLKTGLPLKGKIPEKLTGCLEKKLHQVVQGLESSSRLRFAHGHCFGFNTGALSLIVSQLLSGLLFRFRLVLKLTQTRQAIFDLNMSPNSLEITFCTRKAHGRELGVSLGSGPDFPLLSAGVMLNLTASKYESGRLDGVCLRIPRYPQGDEFVRQRAQALMSLLLVERPADSMPLLTEILERFPEVSVGRLGAAVEHRHSSAIELEFGVGVGVSHIRAVTHASLYAEREWSRSERSANLGGQFCAEKQRKRAGAEAGIAAQVRVGSKEGLNGRNSLAVSPGTLAGASLDLGCAGVQVRREVFKQGAAFSNKSFFEVEYAHRSDFEQAHALLQETEAESPSLKPLALQTAIPPDTRLSYARRHELKPDARLWLNQLESLRILFSQPENGKLAHKNALALITKTQEHALRTPENYQLTSLRSYLKTDRRGRFGLNLAGILETTKASQSTVLLKASTC
jgi:hypothetical protein